MASNPSEGSEVESACSSIGVAGVDEESKWKPTPDRGRAERLVVLVTAVGSAVGMPVATVAMDRGRGESMRVNGLSLIELRALGWMRMIGRGRGGSEGRESEHSVSTASLVEAIYIEGSVGRGIAD